MNRIFAFAAVCAFFTLNLRAQENPLLRRLLDLPAPPPVSKNDDEKNARPETFYKKENVPPDDAPIADLIDYWKYQGSVIDVTFKSPKVSVRNAERLLEKIELSPTELKDFLSIMPDDPAVAEKIKNILDISQNTEDVGESWRESVKGWLKFNSKFFIDELISKASKAKDQEKYGTVNSDEELTALAKLEWETAEPILKKLENDSSNPRTAALAKTLFYKNAIAANDSSNIERYRNELKEILTDKNLPARARDTASDALFETNWDGQDEFYFSLMEDKTLFQTTDGSYLLSSLETLPEKNPAKWIPIMTKLVGSKNREVHNAAVRNLIKFETKESLEPLIPWLSDPDWAEINWEPGGRNTLMQIVSRFDLPESVPGLIWIVENEDDEAHWAARSLKIFKDSRAVPALKNALNRIKDESDRTKIIEALIACHGLTAEEQMSAIEAYAEFITKPENADKITSSAYSRESSLPVVISIGNFLAGQKEPSENLILRAIERHKILEKEKPEAAKILSGIMAKWKGRLIDLELLRKISANETDTETVIGALARRKELKESVPNDIYAMRGKIGLPGAIAACILEDENDILSAFGSRNAEMLVGTLACARLLRKPLPIREVGVMLDSNDRLLALAAERYLESEDSLEARNLVLSKHKNEALILGARTSFNPANQSFSNDYKSPLNQIFLTVSKTFSYSSDFSELDKYEQKLRKEILENPDLTAIYAHLPNHYEGQRVLRIYKSHATFTYIEDNARYMEKTVSKEDLEKFFQVLREINIDEFASKSVSCHYDCYVREFVALGRNGGRRIFAGSGMFALGRLDRLENFFTSGESKTHYQLSKKIKGLEILLADEKYQPAAIWKNGDDFRVLVEDKVKEQEIEQWLDSENKVDLKNEEIESEERSARYFQRKAEREFEHYEWRNFSNGKLGEKVDEPLNLPFLQTKFFQPSVKELRDNGNLTQTRLAAYEIRAGENETGGLWKMNRGEKTEFKKGNYANPFVAGNYVVAAKTDGDWNAPNYVVRINLQTGKETKINLPPADDFYPVAFVPARNKFLLYRDTEPESEKPAEYYLLDAATGQTEPVKGEFRPLKEQTFRNLQPTGNKDEFWAAVYDDEKDQTVIGRYDAKNFAIKPVLTVPEISLNSMQIWVDETAGKVYFIYRANYFGESHLLSLPLNAEKQ